MAHNRPETPEELVARLRAAGDTAALAAEYARRIRALYRGDARARGREAKHHATLPDGWARTTTSLTDLGAVREADSPNRRPDPSEYARLRPRYFHALLGGGEAAFPTMLHVLRALDALAGEGDADAPLDVDLTGPKRRGDPGPPGEDAGPAPNHPDHTPRETE